MAQKIFEKYGSRANPPTTAYPLGSIKNESLPGANDGTPLDQDWGNDIIGLLQALLADANITASGNPDTATNSQYLEALKKIPTLNGVSVFTTVADLKTGNTINNTTVDFAELSAVRAQVATVFNNTITNAGGNVYIVKTLTQHRSDINNPSWEPDGNRDFYLDNGVIYVAVSKDPQVNIYQVGWTGDKASPRLLSDSIEQGITFKFEPRTTSLDSIFAQWHAGQKAPVCFFGDSTTDGAITTLDGTTPATVWNRDKLVNGEVPDGFNDDHDDSEVPNAYPNILQRLARLYFNSSTLRTYNAGYRGQQLQNGWAVDNVVNAIYANAAYADTEMIVIGFGLNDIASNPNDTEVIERTKFYTEALILDAYARGVQPALMLSNVSGQTGPDAYDSNRVYTVSDKIKIDIAKKYGLEVIDQVTMILDYTNYNREAISFADITADRLHFNDLGHLKQAEYIFKEMAGRMVLDVSQRDTLVDFTDPAAKYNSTNTSISGGFTIQRGRNQLRRVVTIPEASIADIAGENMVDLWVWNGEGDKSVLYRGYATDENAQQVLNFNDIPQFHVESLLATANDFYEQSYTTSKPEVTGETVGADRFGLPYYLKPLNWGLNRVRIEIPTNIQAEIDNGYNGGANIPFGWFEFLSECREDDFSVMQYNTGFNNFSLRPWRNTLRESGGLYAGVNSGSDNINQYLPEEPQGLNRYALTDDGDFVEFLINCNFREEGGVILGYNLAENRTLTPTEDEKKKITQTGPYWTVEASPSQQFIIRGYAPSDAQTLIFTPGISAGAFENVDVVLRLERLTFDSFTLSLRNPNLDNTFWTETYTSADPDGLTFASEFFKGITGGIVSRPGMANNFILNKLSMRQNSKR